MGEKFCFIIIERQEGEAYAITIQLVIVVC